MRSLVLVLVLFWITPAYAASFVTDFGAVGDNLTDNTAALDRAIGALCVSATDRTLHMPVGRFRFASPPDPIPCALNLVGEGAGVTHLIADFDGGALLYIVGGRDVYGGGSLRDMNLMAGEGRSVGFAVWVQAQSESDPTVASRNPHGFLFDNVLIGREDVYPFTGRWHYGVYLDGSLNTQPVTGVAPFLRFIRLRDVSVSAYMILPYLVYYTSGVRVEMADCPIPIDGATETLYLWHALATVIAAAPCQVTEVP